MKRGPPTGTAQGFRYNLEPKDTPASARLRTNAVELNRHSHGKIRGSVVSLSFIIPHPPDEKKKK